MPTKPAWDLFFEESIRKIFVPDVKILDIGAGLRVDASRGNVEDPKNAWIKPLLSSVTYQVLDPVDTYHPDIIGDVMHMPQIADASYDAVLCLAVLEHVPRAWDAVREMKRVLKPGGTLLIYVPFLSPYHAMPGYYGDFVRFTGDGVRALLEGWDDIKVTPVRGPVETLMHLLPGRLHRLTSFGRWIDGFRSGSGNQTAGHNATAHKPLV